MRLFAPLSMLKHTMWKPCLYRRVLATLLLVTVAAVDARDETANTLTSAQVAGIVNEVGELYRREYLTPSLGEEVLRTLTQRLARGEYHDLDASSLAERLTADLQKVTRDVHSYVKHQPNAQSTVGAQVERQEILGPGIDRAERLAGNTGYIHIALFTIPPSFSKSVDRAMLELSDTRALIIDVRDTPGGSSQSVAYLCSYFFEPKQRVHLNSFVYRNRPAIEEWTRAVPTPYLRKKVFVLTSSTTGSGAEGFAYQMQAFGKARIVGTKTKGGAHTGELKSIGHGLFVFVPTGYALNPKTKKNWEKTGVLPDVPTEARAALETALGLLSRLDPRAIRLDGPLPRGPSQAPIPIRSESRIRRDQSFVLDAREQHVRHQDVGDGELVCRDEVAVSEPALQVRQHPIRPADQELAVLAAAPIRHPVEHHQAKQRRLDRVHRGEAPAHHLRLAGAVAGDQAAGLLRQVDEDGGGFGQHQPVVVDRRDLFEGTEPSIGFGAQVVRGVVHAGQLERQLHLFECPQHAQVAGVAARDSVDLRKAVELEHVMFLG